MTLSCLGLITVRFIVIIWIDTRYCGSHELTRVGIKLFKILWPVDYVLVGLGLPGKGEEGRNLVRSWEEGI